MATTRSKTDTYLIGNSKAQFEGRVLPTSKEVLQVYFYYHKHEKLPQGEAVSKTIKDLVEIWTKARIPVSEERSIVRKLNLVLRKYRSVCRNKKRRGTSQEGRESAFVKNSLSRLFDIAHVKALHLIKIEEDKTFLEDQRSARKYVMGGVDEPLAAVERKRRMRQEKDMERRRREEERKQKISASFGATTMACLSSSSMSPSESDSEYVDPNIPSTSKNTKKIKKSSSDIITPSLACALDRTNVSNRNAAFLLSAVSPEIWNETGRSNVPISASTIRRARINIRKKIAGDIKMSFSPSSVDAPLVLHFDGKLLPAIYGGPEKMHRVAILVSGYKIEKILGVPKVEDGTGKSVAEAAFNAAHDWNVREKIVGMSFDTTAANTGRLKGACVQFEKKIGKKLLWLPCRHHILEVLCGDVFKVVFGDTKGPDVSLFRKFQESWAQIDKNTYEKCSDKRLDGDLQELKDEVVNFIKNILQREREFLPREDYLELLELSLIFLGTTPPRGVRFRAPGAFHHARWMSKVLYIIKIYIFRQQFKLTQREEKLCLDFDLFAVLIYVQFWILAPRACDGPVNDLKLMKALENFKVISTDISVAALGAVRRHLWYLGQELAPIAIFSDLIPAEKKRLLAKLVLETRQDNWDQRSIRYTGKDDLSNKDIEFFIGPASYFLFTTLQLDTAFLYEEPKTWEHLSSYQDAKRVTKSLKVVNDCAERGVALATTFNSSITKNEDQKQFLFQVVEDHRKRFPNTNRSTLWKPSQLKA